MKIERRELESNFVQNWGGKRNNWDKLKQKKSGKVKKNQYNRDELGKARTKND